MARTEIAGFRHISYKTLQAVARKTISFLLEINGMGIVQGELDSEDRTEPVRPKSDRLVTDVDAALME
jgi:hypothetical protein